MKIFLILTIKVALLGNAYGNSGIKPDLETFHTKIKPILEKYCIECHGSKKEKGKIRFDNIDPDIINGRHVGKWEDAQETFNTGEMPPEEEKQPSALEREILTNWLDVEFKKARQAGKKSKLSNIRRLTRYELRYSLEDLFKVNFENEVKSLPDESTNPESGLKNNSNQLKVSSLYLESYFESIFASIGKLKSILAAEPNVKIIDLKRLEDEKHLKLNIKKKASPAKKKNLNSVLGIQSTYLNSTFHNKVSKSSDGIIIQPGGYLTFNIKQTPEHSLEVILKAQIAKQGYLDLYVGTYLRDILKSEKKYSVKLDKAGKFHTYSFKEFTENIQINHKNIFFIRLANVSSQPIRISSLIYKGDEKKGVIQNLLTLGSSKKLSNRDLLKRFLYKVYRRMPTENELSAALSSYNLKLQSNSQLTALLNTYEEILCSPKFFYNGLPKNSSAQKNFHLAENLASFLWCSLPDYHLITDAYYGKIQDPSVLTYHIRRMLKDPRSKRFVEQFTSQWLNTSALYNIAIDDNYYKGFNRTSLKQLMEQETIESINSVFRKGASALNLLSADHVFVNEHLSRFYNLKGVKGAYFRKVNVGNNLRRGGLLTQGTFLISNSDGTNSHAILRGVWLKKILLNDPPPEPPNNVPPFDETIPGFNKMTLNQKMFAHRNNEACRSCHLKIDPWGIAFENYDAIGAWRDKISVMTKTDKKNKKGYFLYKKSNLPIESKAEIKPGTWLNGMADLKRYLLKYRTHGFSEGLTEKLLSFALNRDLDFHDKDLISKLNEDFIRSNYSVPKLIKSIVFTNEFQKGNQ